MATDLTVSISGMHCESCISAIREALTGLSGVSISELRIGEARIRLDNDHTTKNDVFQAIRSVGAFTVDGFSLSEEKSHHDPAPE